MLVLSCVSVTMVMKAVCGGQHSIAVVGKLVVLL